MLSYADRSVPLYLSILICVILADSAVAITPYSFDVPFDIIDACVAGDGSIHLLSAGVPHLRIFEDSVLTEEYDLPEIILPGGMLIDNDWGWFVSDAVAGVVRRYDDSGELLETFPVYERPGAVAALGLSVLCVSRAHGSIGSIEDSGFQRIPINGSGNGEITVNGIYAIYSDGEESLLFTAGVPPEIISSSGTWAFAGDETLHLTEDSLYFSDSEREPVFVGNLQLSRMASSPDGGHIILWQPGCRTIMVIQ